MSSDYDESDLERAVRLDPLLREQLRRLVRDLVEGRFAEIVASGRYKYSSDDLAEAVDGYEATLIDYPADADMNPYVLETTPVDGSTFILDLPLWTIEEGKSDLFLRAIASRVEDHWQIELTGLKVM